MSEEPAPKRAKIAPNTPIVKLIIEEAGGNAKDVHYVHFCRLKPLPYFETFLSERWQRNDNEDEGTNGDDKTNDEMKEISREKVQNQKIYLTSFI